MSLFLIMSRQSLTIILFVYFSGLAIRLEGRPQDAAGSTLQCSNIPGHRCVPFDECDADFTSSTIDPLIVDAIFKPGDEASLGFRTADEASCFTIDVRKEQDGGIVCCDEKSIKSGAKIKANNDTACICVDKKNCRNAIDPRKGGPDSLEACENDAEVCCKPEDALPKTAASTRFCSEFAAEGYSCTRRGNCQEIGPRNVIKEAVEAECTSRRTANDEDEAICCHQSQHITKNSTELDCADFEGYQCVLREDCGAQEDPRTDGILSKRPEDAVCSDPRQGSLDAAAFVCCKKDSIKKKADISCATYAEDGYSCTKNTQCLDTILSQVDGSLALAIRQGSSASHATCPEHEDGSPQVCCLNKKPTEIPIETQSCGENPGYQCIPIQKCGSSDILRATDTETVLVVRQGGEVDLTPQTEICPNNDIHVCCKPKLARTQANNDTSSPSSNYAPKCGQHNPNGLELKVVSPRDGNFATQFGEWPHACLLYQMIDQGTDIFLGGASLIAPGVVLTGAHKIENVDVSRITVRCGDWDVSTEDELYPAQDRKVKSMMVHPRYSGSRLLLNEAALLFVEPEFNLASHLDTVCLPDFPSQGGAQYSQDECVVMGWGKDVYEGVYQKSLKQVKLSIIPHDTCQANLRNTDRLKDDFILDQSFICAGGEKGKDACEGDGGGSLVCKSTKRPDRYELAGIVSWGIECGMENVPGAYVSVANTLCFIDWATKCQHGDKYTAFYDYPQCDNWIEEEISALEKSSDTYAPFYKKEAEKLKGSCNPDLTSFQRNGGQ